VIESKLTLRRRRQAHPFIAGSAKLDVDVCGWVDRAIAWRDAHKAETRRSSLQN